MAETTTTELNLQDLKVYLVQGVGAKSNRPYKAIRLTVDVDGEPHQTLVFVNKVKK